MADYLSRLGARALGAAQSSVSPRVPSRYEGTPAGDDDIEYAPTGDWRDALLTNNDNRASLQSPRAAVVGNLAAAVEWLTADERDGVPAPVLGEPAVDGPAIVERHHERRTEHRAERHTEHRTEHHTGAAERISTEVTTVVTPAPVPIQPLPVVEPPTGEPRTEAAPSHVHIRIGRIEVRAAPQPAAPPPPPAATPQPAETLSLSAYLRGERR